MHNSQDYKFPDDFTMSRQILLVENKQASKQTNKQMIIKR
jgi:hypothetical protein